MSNDDDKFRLVTRSDFDGLVCAVLLRELDVINEIKFGNDENEIYITYSNYICKYRK